MTTGPGSHMGKEGSEKSCIVYPIKILKIECFIEIKQLKVTINLLFAIYEYGVIIFHLSHNLSILNYTVNSTITVTLGKYEQSRL